VDSVTTGKYGHVNTFTFLILSCCVPFLYINNLLWTIQFAQNRLKRIFRVTLVTFLIILTGDLVFIPMYDVKAAAVVYLVATIIEYFNYLRSSLLVSLREARLSPVLCLLAALGGGYLSAYLTDVITVRLIIAIVIYCILLLGMGQLRRDDLKYFFHLFRSKKAEPYIKNQ
jgi:hypothetical protein